MSSKQDELAALEARKQAILEGMNQDAAYPEEGAGWGQSYGDHMADVSPEQDRQSLAQSRPLDANPYGARPAPPRDPADGPRRTMVNQPGLEIPLDENPYGRTQEWAPGGQRGGTQYPEQESQSSQIAALQKRLKALQGY